MNWEMFVVAYVVVGTANAAIALRQVALCVTGRCNCRPWLHDDDVVAIRGDDVKINIYGQRQTLKIHTLRVYTGLVFGFLAILGRKIPFWPLDAVRRIWTVFNKQTTYRSRYAGNLSSCTRCDEPLTCHVWRCNKCNHELVQNEHGEPLDACHEGASLRCSDGEKFDPSNDERSQETALIEYMEERL